MDSRLDPGCGLVERVSVSLGEVLREVMVGQVEVALEHRQEGGRWEE